MAKQNKDYGYDIQKLYLEMMLANAETFVRCQSIFDFDSKKSKVNQAGRRKSLSSDANETARR